MVEDFKGPIDTVVGEGREDCYEMARSVGRGVRTQLFKPEDEELMVTFCKEFRNFGTLISSLELRLTVLSVITAVLNCNKSVKY